MKTCSPKARTRSFPRWLLLLSSIHILLLSMSYYAFCGEYPIRDIGGNTIASLTALLLVILLPVGKKLPILLRKYPWHSCVVCCAACAAVIGVTEYLGFRSDFLWCFIAISLALLVYALWDEDDLGTVFCALVFLSTATLALAAKEAMAAIVLLSCLAAAVGDGLVKKRFSVSLLSLLVIAVMFVCAYSIIEDILPYGYYLTHEIFEHLHPEHDPVAEGYLALAAREVLDSAKLFAPCSAATDVLFAQHIIRSHFITTMLCRQGWCFTALLVLLPVVVQMLSAFLLCRKKQGLQRITSMLALTCLGSYWAVFIAQCMGVFSEVPRSMPLMSDNIAVNVTGCVLVGIILRKNSEPKCPRRTGRIAEALSSVFDRILSGKKADEGSDDMPPTELLSDLFGMQIAYFSRKTVGEQIRELNALGAFVQCFDTEEALHGFLQYAIVYKRFYYHGFTKTFDCFAEHLSVLRNEIYIHIFISIESGLDEVEKLLEQVQHHCPEDASPLVSISFSETLTGDECRMSIYTAVRDFVLPSSEKGEVAE